MDTRIDTIAHATINRRLFRIMLAVLVWVMLSALFTSTAHAMEPGVMVTIPSLELNAPIVPIGIKQFPNGNITWDTTGLNMTVGHLEGTAWFGQPGNIVLGGHSERARGQADIFAELDQVNVGDSIVVSDHGAERHYQVTELRNVDFADVSVIYPTEHEQLTLITCDVVSYDDVSDYYARRVIVIAQPVG